MNQKTSWDSLLDDVLVPIESKFADRVRRAREIWNAKPIEEQRRIYYFLREQKRSGKTIEPNPIFAIQGCHPEPTNWNGKEGINKMIKSTKMVIAKYQGSYGTYTALEAKLFEMTDVKPLNF